MTDQAACCSPARAATAPASTARCRPWRRRSSSTARRSTSASRSSTTPTSSRPLERRGAVFVDETDEVPRGRRRRVLRPRCRAGRCTSEAAARSLRTIDATCPLVTKVHAEARRFDREDFDILLIGHEGHEEVVGHHRRGARAHPPRRRPGRASTASRCATRTRWPGCRRRRCRSTRRMRDGARRCASSSPLLLDPPSDDICYATQNRQVAVKEIAADVRAGARGRLRQLVQLGAPGRGGAGRRRRRPPTSSTTSRTIDDGVARGRRDGRRHERRVGAGGAGRARCWRGWPSAATATSRRCVRPRSACTFALPPSCAATCASALDVIAASCTRPPG